MLLGAILEQQVVLTISAKALSTTSLSIPCGRRAHLVEDHRTVRSATPQNTTAIFLSRAFFRYCQCLKSQVTKDVQFFCSVPFPFLSWTRSHPLASLATFSFKLEYTCRRNHHTITPPKHHCYFYSFKSLFEKLCFKSQVPCRTSSLDQGGP